MGDMVVSGVRAICLLVFSDNGKPCFDETVARKLTAVGVPCFACTPQRLPELLEGALRGGDLTALAARVTQKDSK